MNKVSLCIILNSDYWGTLYSFECSGFKVIEDLKEFIVKDTPKEYINVIGEVQIELLVAVTPTTDKRLVDYFKPIASVIHTYEEPITTATIYNNLFRQAKQDYICIFNPYVFLQPHWLTELIYYRNYVDNSGVVSICDNHNNTEIIPLPCNDKEALNLVYIPKSSFVDERGVCLFLRQHLYLIGAFDENELIFGGDHLNQYQLRCIAMGYSNFYIPSQSCVILKKWLQWEPIKLRTSNEYVANSLIEMKQHKSYYKPL